MNDRIECGKQHSWQMEEQGKRPCGRARLGEWTDQEESQVARWQ